MFFPASEIEVALWLPPLVAFGISFCTSMAGVSGAFLLLPFQMSVLGYTAPSVSATNQVYNIIAIPSGVYRYWRERRLLPALAGAIVAGTLPGVLLGAIIRVRFLPEARHFKLFAAGVLLYIAIRMVRDLWRNRGNLSRPGELLRINMAKPNLSPRQSRATKAGSNLAQVVFTYEGTTYTCPTAGVFVLSCLVGIIGGIYGIGGGAIIAPFLVSFFGLPVHFVAGAALLGTLVTSVAGVIFYHLIAIFHPQLSIAPDWLLGSLFGLGGMVGMYLGARCQKHVPAKAIKLLLVLVLTLTALSYTRDFLFH